MTTNLVNCVKVLRRTLSMTQEDFARLLGVTVGTVARWEEGRARPTPATTRKLDRLRQAIESLHEVTEYEHMSSWLQKPHRGLENHAPCELLDNEFAFKKLLNLIESIKWGTYS